MPLLGTEIVVLFDYKMCIFIQSTMWLSNDFIIFFRHLGICSVNKEMYTYVSAGQYIFCRYLLLLWYGVGYVLCIQKGRDVTIELYILYTYIQARSPVFFRYT